AGCRQWWPAGLPLLEKEGRSPPRNRRRASSASLLESASPSTMAPMIARPDTPIRSVATEPSLTWVPNDVRVRLVVGLSAPRVNDLSPAHSEPCVDHLAPIFIVSGCRRPRHDDSLAERGLGAARIKGVSDPVEIHEVTVETIIQKTRVFDH